MPAGAAVLGIGMSVPERTVTNNDLSRTLDTSDEWIRQRTGIQARHIAEPDEATSTFAARAGRRALEEAELDADDLDLILVATATPDYSVPGSSPLVQKELGARRAGAIDLNVGCTGFVAALSVASSMITAGSYKHILVCGADTLSRITNWDDRTTAVLFGDGAGAAVLGPSEHSRMGPFVLGSDGSKVDLLWVPAGGSRRPADETTLAERAHGIRMKGQDVYKNACDRMTEAALAVLGGQPVSSVDLFVAHQANARIVSAVADRLKLTQEQAVCNIAQYGNTSAASIPIALCELEEEGRLKDGMRVLLAAFGAGFSWGAGLVDWGRG